MGERGARRLGFNSLMHDGMGWNTRTLTFFCEPEEDLTVRSALHSTKKNDCSWNRRETRLIHITERLIVDVSTLLYSAPLLVPHSLVECLLRGLVSTR